MNDTVRRCLVQLAAGRDGILAAMTRPSEVTIENVRDYWDQRPCNIRHSRATIGTREYSDAVEAGKYFVKRHIPRFAQFERWRGKRVLEIGCAIGTYTINFARAGASVTAVGISEESSRVVRQRLAVTRLGNVVFYRANAEELDEVVQPECCDLVYSLGAIGHTPRRSVS